jgi:hypothetical protein
MRRRVRLERPPEFRSSKPLRPPKAAWHGRPLPFEVVGRLLSGILSLAGSSAFLVSPLKIAAKALR